jgi:sporulation protein YlmC with PRC-barrel domain
MAWTLEDAKALRGLTVVDPDGAHIGTIEDIYLDRDTGEAEWAAVKTGLFGRRLTFVPIADAHTNPSGDVVVHVPKEKVKQAPQIEPRGVLSVEEERRLYEHYGRTDYGGWDGKDRTTRLGLGAEEPPPAAAGPDGPLVIVRLRRLVVVGEELPAR